MSIESDAKVIEAGKRIGEPDDLIRLSTGVVLRGIPASSTTLIAVMAAFPRPKPPMWRDPTMGREMENYADPDYESRVNAWKSEQGDAMLTAFILYGTELVSKPADMSGPQPEKKNKDWLLKYSLLGLPMLPEDKDWRYLMWVKTIACVSAEDTNSILEVVGRLSGVSKKDVQAAGDFPGGDKAD